jgi:fructokinase
MGETRTRNYELETMKLLAYGEILWDIINSEEHLGGAPFNFAAHSAKCGNTAFIISRLGDDLRGRTAYNKCREYGVDNSLVQWDREHPTGFVTVVLDKGQPDYTIHENVAYDFIRFEKELEDLSKNEFDVFYFGSLIQRSSTSAATLRQILRQFSFRHIFYDVNLRKGGYDFDTIHRSLLSCTILKLNNDEVPVISPMLFDQIYSNEDFCKSTQSTYPGITTIVITAAEKGCYVYQEGQLHAVAVKRVEVNDAVGAGDAFSAAFMHAFVRGADAVSAARVANELGAFVATQSGPIPEYTDEIRTLLAQGFREARP